MTTTRILAAALAAAAITTPSAFARPVDPLGTPAPLARPADLSGAPAPLARPADLSGAPAHHAPASPGAPTWPAHPQPIAAPPAAATSHDGGDDTATIALAIAGSALAVGALGGLAGRTRRIRRRRAIA